MGLVGKLLWERPKDTGFRFGFISILLVSIALIYPSFYNLGYSDPMLAQFTTMLLIGLVMSMMFAFMLHNQSKVQVDTKMTGDAIFKQMRVLVVGVLAGVILVGVNIASNAGLGLLEGSISNENAFFMGLLAGVSEELFFRGFIQTMIRVYVPSLIFAIIPSALIFALFHFFAYGLSVTALGVMFALGVFLGILHEIFNDIGVPMIAHIVNNTVAMLPLVLTALTDNIVIITALVAVVIVSYAFAVNRR